MMKLISQSMERLIESMALQVNISQAMSLHKGNLTANKGGV